MWFLERWNQAVLDKVGLGSRYLICILWLFYMIACSYFLFMRGFLLNREVLPFHASCQVHDSFCSNLINQNSSIPIDNVALLSCLFQNEQEGANNDTVISSQWCPTRKVRVILLVIDALRYDFTVYNSSNNVKPLPYQNKLSVIHHTLLKHPDRSRLFQFVADPPTTTMQRLNGLTTGSLPTFIDIVKNFASSAIVEDNIIDQVRAVNKSIVFMGDDTWTGLYPKQFLRQYAFPSFNTWDLDTVDKGVRKHLIPEVEKKDWDLLIAHFLGVDHCGHRYGPHHLEMKRKLLEINQTISEVMEYVDKDTVLFVIGDHGMTPTGDHGGDSDSELNSALFMYSGSPLYNSSQPLYKVRQIDFVPTLATLLGAPIPFSNLGTTILSVLPSNVQSLLTLWTNVEQITYYIKYYMEHNKQFSSAKLDNIMSNYTELKNKLMQLNTTQDQEKFIVDAHKYLEYVRTMCTNLWTKFDAFSMSRGLLLMFLSLFFIFLIIDGIPGDILIDIFFQHFLFSFKVVVLTNTSLIFLYYHKFIEEVELLIYFLSTIVCIFFLATIIIQNWAHIATHWHQHNQAKSWHNVLVRCFMLFSISGLFSNSYIVEESSVFAFLLISVVFINILYFKVEPLKRFTSNMSLNCRKSTQDRIRIIASSMKFKVCVIACIIMLLIRCSTPYWRCREEQQNCVQYKLQGSTQQCLISAVFLALFIIVARNYLRDTGNLTGYSFNIFFSKYAPSICIVCLGAFWILNSLPSEMKVVFVPKQINHLPIVILATTLLMIVTFFVQPLSVYYARNTSDVSTLDASNYNVNLIIPTIFHQLKEFMLKKNDNVRGYPIVFGLASSYSASFINVMLGFCILASLVLGEMLATSVILMVTCLLCICILNAIIRQQQIVLTNQLFHVSWLVILCWGFSSIYWFYATGHQSTVSSIHWDIIFITRSITNSDIIMPGLVIGLNTFISFAIHALLLPLILVIPFTLHAIFPKFIPLQEKTKEMKQGELVLFANQNLLYSGLFSLVSKYIIFHGFRLFISMVAAAIHCRHLMVWKIFAPKLIFEGAALVCITIPFAMLGFFLIVRITNCMEKFVRKLEDEYS
uniref:GPI ethanolamine phosphate transferase 3 n=1 Tax=Cacopsylla melanoneura TaxID=428564 RepID=A0A8D9ABB3_9HEMI